MQEFGKDQRSVLNVIKLKKNNDLIKMKKSNRIKNKKQVQKDSDNEVGLLKEFFSTSSLHGVRYFVEKERHWLERIWWIFGVTVSFYCCGRLIYDTYFKWYQNPVIISFADLPTQVWEIPFPALTICSNAKINLTIFNIVNAYKYVLDNFPEKIEKQTTFYLNRTKDEDKFLEAALHMCDKDLSGMVAGLYEYTENTTDSSVIHLLREFQIGLHDTISDCLLTGTQRELFDKNCSKYFDEILTEEGLCFTFNMLNGKELYNHNISPDYFMQHISSDEHSSVKWNPYVEENEETSFDIDEAAYPHRVIGSGMDGYRFYFNLKSESQNFNGICHSSAVEGFKIIIHTPDEFPQTKYAIEVPTFHQVTVSVKPAMITTSDELKGIEPNRRGCFFGGERKLLFLKEYTQRNCELECLFNFTLSQCGCVTVFMPRDASTPICGFAKMLCYFRARKNLLKLQVMENYKQQSSKGCNCLPSCTSLTYDTEISKNPFRAKPENKNPETYTSITFKDNKFTTSVRSQRYGVVDFIANCGGLFGLFLGASFLSVLELLYFFSLRLVFTVRARMQRKNMLLQEIIIIKPVRGAVKNNTKY